MTKPKTQSADIAVTETVVAEMKTVFDNAGVSDPDARVHTEDSPFGHFPHAIVLFPNEGRSQLTESKDDVPVVSFPQVNIYDKGNGARKAVAQRADDIMQRLTDSSLTISDWLLSFNRLQFNQGISTSPADEATIFGRSVQFEYHLESTS